MESSPGQRPGLDGVAETFLLLALAERVVSLDHDLIRTLIYLKLSISGHLTIFVTRTRGPFWSRPAPARILLAAVIGTQVVATLIAVYGILMTPLGWRWAGVVGLRAVLVPRRGPRQTRHHPLAGRTPFGRV